MCWVIYMSVLYLLYWSFLTFRYLLANCPGLQFIRFGHGEMALKHVNLTYMPRNLKTLDLCLKGCFRNPRSPQRQVCQFGRPPLQQLESLTLRYTEFSPELFQRLCHFHQLRELILHHCSYLTLHGFRQITERIPELTHLWFRFCIVPLSNRQEFEEMFHLCLLKLKHLKHFKIQIMGINTRYPQLTNHRPLELDIIQGELADLTDLQSLWLESINILFPLQITELKELKEFHELELVNCDSVDNEVVKTICQNLRHLKRLNFKCCKNITDNCMSFLIDLQLLEYLNVDKCKLSIWCIYHTAVVMENLNVLHLTKDFSHSYVCYMTKMKTDLPGLNIHEHL